MEELKVLGSWVPCPARHCQVAPQFWEDLGISATCQTQFPHPPLQIHYNFASHHAIMGLECTFLIFRDLRFLEHGDIEGASCVRTEYTWIFYDLYLFVATGSPSVLMHGHGSS